jgi:hypothetical protein
MRSTSPLDFVIRSTAVDRFAQSRLRLLVDRRVARRSRATPWDAIGATANHGPTRSSVVAARREAVVEIEMGERGFIPQTG